VWPKWPRPSGQDAGAKRLRTCAKESAPFRCRRRPPLLANTFVASTRAGAYGTLSPIVLSRKHFLCALGCAAFGVLTLACSGGTTAPGASPGDSSTLEATSPPPELMSKCVDGGLRVAFNPIYSAFIDDGLHTFQVPAVVTGSNAEVTWTADKSIVQMEAQGLPNEVMITVLRAGMTNILVQSADGKCGFAPLIVSAATENDWKIGNARYNNGTSLHLNAAAQTEDGASPLEQGTGGPQSTNCHGVTATGGPFTDVSHTPEQTGGFSDQDLINIFAKGQFPPGAYFDQSIVPYRVWQTWHKWGLVEGGDITPDQYRGVITYLRSLTPVPQKGQVNFNAYDAGGSAAGAGASDAGAVD